MNEFLKRLSAYEPAVLRGAIVSLFSLLALVGVEWATEDAAVEIWTFLAAVLPLLTGVVVRPAVTPNTKVGAEAAVDEPAGPFEAGEAAPYPEGTPVDVVPDVHPLDREDY